MRQRAATLLAIGNELTDGQILNSNGQWLARALLALGVEITAHLVVPDDETLIKSALNYAAQASGLIFVCGGLGPTSDDRTREAVASWAGLPLVLDRESWSRITEKLAARQVPVREAHQKQSLFPQGALPLRNSAGTAEGFSLKLAEGATRLWVLPGPPRELEAVWQEGVSAELTNLVPPGEHKILRTWRCLDARESEVAELVEPCLINKNYQIGYRLTAPYVEVKLWHKASESAAAELVWQAIDVQLKGRWQLLRDSEDPAQSLIEELVRAPSPTTIIDAATDGTLAERLAAGLRLGSKRNLPLTLQTELSVPAQQLRPWLQERLQAGPGNLLVVAGFDLEGAWLVGSRWSGQLTSQHFSGELLKNLRGERARRSVCERTLHFWSKQLSALTAVGRP